MPENSMFYVNSLFSLLRPLKVVIWGGWSRLSLILAYIAKQNDIPFVFAEWGWVPGTIQFDPAGIAGNSVYAKNYRLKEYIGKYKETDLYERICGATGDFTLAGYLETVNGNGDKIRRVHWNGRERNGD